MFSGQYIFSANISSIFTENDKAIKKGVNRIHMDRRQLKRLAAIRHNQTIPYRAKLFVERNLCQYQKLVTLVRRKVSPNRNFILVIIIELWITIQVIQEVATAKYFQKQHKVCISECSLTLSQWEQKMFVTIDSGKYF